jgi:hypothetical protein
MTGERHQSRNGAAWRLARRQHGVVARRQLLALGYSEKAIEHRLAIGRLHRLRRGVYAVGREETSAEGRWTAALLVCGEGSFLTHRSAGALYGICEERPGRIEVGVRDAHTHRIEDIRTRRRPTLAAAEVGFVRGVAVTSPVQTMLDLATVQGPRYLLRSINEADIRDVIDAERLRREIEERPGAAGVRPLRRLLDRDTFALSREELERLFLPLAREAGLPLPLTQVIVNEFEVDFFWPDLRLVVETDGWRYHRTPAAQSRDALRGQVHTASGLTPLRFSHHQIKYEPDHVRRILAETAARL